MAFYMRIIKGGIRLVGLHNQEAFVILFFLMIL
jgi:hypothetical protein